MQYTYFYTQKGSIKQPWDEKEGSNLNMLGMAELGKGCSKHVDTVVDQGGFWNQTSFLVA